jgi:hypothetical protein
MRVHRVATLLAGVLLLLATIVPSAASAAVRPLSGTWYSQVWGGRYSATYTWGQGLLSASGDVSRMEIDLFTDPCSLEILTDCIVWGNGPMNATQWKYGAGNLWAPTSGVALDGPLGRNHKYRIRIQTYIWTICCGRIDGENTSNDIQL